MAFLLADPIVMEVINIPVIGGPERSRIYSPCTECPLFASYPLLRREFSE
jgi:hypothetical protein